MTFKIDITKRYRTRVGHPVRILCTDRVDDEYPIVGLFRHDSVEKLICWTNEGKPQHFNTKDYSLVEVPEWEDIEEGEPVLAQMAPNSDWFRAVYAGIYRPTPTTSLPTVYSPGNKWTSGGCSQSVFACRRLTLEELSKVMDR